MGYYTKLYTQNMLSTYKGRILLSTSVLTCHFYVTFYPLLAFSFKMVDLMHSRTLIELAHFRAPALGTRSTFARLFLLFF